MIEAAFFGSLSRDAEHKVSSSGKEYLRLNVRVGDGDAAQWISVMAFEPETVAAIDRFAKGARVYVEGKLSVSEWTDAAGVKRLGLSAMAFHCRLAQIGRNGKRAKAAADRKIRSAYSPAPLPFNDSIPF